MKDTMITVGLTIILILILIFLSQVGQYGTMEFVK